MKRTKYKKPFIICVEGMDGSGKQSQTEMLHNKLVNFGHKAIRIDFPQYNRWHSFLVRYYLKGKFTKDPNKINPYIASLFYAIDRFFAYYTYIKRDYSDYNFIIFDRYVESNMIYQGLKANRKFTGDNFDDNKKLQNIIKFIEFVEYKIMRLPKPDMTIVLNISVDRVIQNLNGAGKELDIHENREVQINAYNTLQYLIKRQKWVAIDCMLNETEMKTKSQIGSIIATEIFTSINEVW